MDVDRQEFRSLKDLYRLRCRAEGKSPRTVPAYDETLGKFERALPEGALANVALVTQEHVYAHLARYAERKPETRHRYLREPRCFFGWLVDQGHLDVSPFRGIRNVKLPQRIVQPFSSEDVVALLAACGAGQMGVRDRAVLLTLLDTGARCSEVVQLDLADLNLAAGRLRVLHAKGNKQRSFPSRGAVARDSPPT